MVRNPISIIILAGLLGGCFDSSSSTPEPEPQPQPQPQPTTETLSGIVAVGVPVTGATVTARCGSDYQDSTTSGGGGGWSMDVPEGATPCLLRASAGTPASQLFSFAFTAGHTGITPLTTLATVRAVSNTTGNSQLDDLFGEDADELELDDLVDPLRAAIDALVADLTAAGYEVPDQFDPFLDEFDATPGDAYDDLLEALGAAITGAGQSLEDLVDAWVAGGSLPEPDEGDGDEPPTDPPAGQFARAGFQGLDIGPADGQGDGTGDFGWGQDWEADANQTTLQIVDPGAVPVDYQRGDIVITGGDRALTRPDSEGSGFVAAGRCLAAPVSSDDGFYLSFVVRLKDGYDGLGSGGSVLAAGGNVSITSASNRSPFIGISLSGHPGVGGFTGSAMNVNGRLSDDFDFHLLDEAAMSRDAYLLVVRMYNDDTDEGGFNRMAVWVNPESATTEPAPQLVLEDSHYSLPTSLQCLDFGTGNARGLHYDEFRFAADWASLFSAD